MSDIVVIYFPTIMDGPVLRWYADLEAADAGDELGSASRSRVSAERLDLPDEVSEQMIAAHVMLRDGDVDTATNLATHTKAWGGAISPVAS